MLPARLARQPASVRTQRIPCVPVTPAVPGTFFCKPFCRLAVLQLKVLAMYGERDGMRGDYRLIEDALPRAQYVQVGTLCAAGQGRPSSAGGG